MIIGHYLEGCKKGHRSGIPEQEPPTPIRSEEASCHVVQGYYCKVGASALSPKILDVASGEDVIPIGQLWDTIHKQGLQYANGTPSQEFLGREQFVFLRIFVYLR
jgi:hypothetical protein